VNAQRSWLFVPGDRQERFGKALDSGADAAIVDLEDAVAPEHKEMARQHVVALLGERSAYVRINAADTEWYADDLASLAGARNLAGMVLPKSTTAEQIDAVAAVLPPAAEIVALIESAAGLRNADAIADAARTSRLAFGNMDFSLDISSDTADSTLLYARSRLVVASRAAGIAAPLDGVTTDLDNADSTMRDARAGRRLGFGGKLCIHPRQVPLVNDAFSYTPDQLTWARRVIAAAAASHGAAVRVDGQMIDKPRLALANRIASTDTED
jgi:citrate lyase beta subunit